MHQNPQYMHGHYNRLYSFVVVLQQYNRHMKHVVRESQEKIILWWNAMQYRFLFPPLYGMHTHAWDHIDTGVTGCRFCGVVHICSVGDNNIVHCLQETQDDTSIVCVYTGIVLCMTSLVYENISIQDYKAGNTMSQHNPAQVSVSLTDKTEIITNLVHRAIHKLMYSSDAGAARQAETTRIHKKIESSFLTAVNSDSYHFIHNDIISCIESSLYAISEYRPVPTVELIPPKTHWDSLVNNIVTLLIWMELSRPYNITANNDRMFNLIISLIYMSAHGIESNHVVFLQKHPILSSILPLELMMRQYLHLNSKLVTDGENVVKRCINDMMVAKKKHPNIQISTCKFSFLVPICTC